METVHLFLVGGDGDRTSFPLLLRRSGSGQTLPELACRVRSLT